MRPVKCLFTVPMQRPTGDALGQAQSYPWVNDNGLAMIGAAAKAAGSETTIWSWDRNYSGEDVARYLRETKPDVVGIKTFTTHFQWVLDTLKVIRADAPDARILLGGPHATTSAPDDLFDEFPGLFDFVIAGDGELAVSRLIALIKNGDSLESDETLKTIPGLVYKSKNGVVKIPNSYDVAFADLPRVDWTAQPPSAFQDLKNEFNGHSVFYEDSRGCPCECAHCNAGTMNGSRPRHKGIEQVCAEIEELVAVYNVNYIIFSGNAFLADLRRTEELCEWFIKKRLGVRWSCTGAAYVRRIEDRELVRTMKRAGCNKIIFGIESGDDNVRERLNYPSSIGEIGNIVNAIHQNGIITDAYFMLGLPGETVREMRATLACAARLSLDRISFCIHLPLPGTRGYFDVLKKHGLKRIDWSGYDFSNPPMLASVATVAEVKRSLLMGRVIERSGMARGLVRFVAG